MNTNHVSTKLLRAASILVLTFCCFAFGTSRLYGQWPGGENTTTSTYCTDCWCNVGHIAGVCDHTCPATGALFMCVSSSVNGLSTTNYNADLGAASFCSGSAIEFVHLRNFSSACSKIDKITFTITQAGSSSDFFIGDPFTQWGGTGWTSPWTIDDITTSTSITNQACNSWGATTTRDIEFNMPSPTGYFVLPCYHWSVLIMGANITNIKIHWKQPNGTNIGDANFANPTVNTSACPQSDGNNGWPGC
jgi:hypothetical protein